MKVLVVGTWRKDKAESYREKAEQVGKEIARRNFTLVSGGGTGISEIVVNSYRKNKGKKYIAYLPDQKEMRKVGEKVGPNPDKIIQTTFDYPTRNVEMVKFCDVMIAMPGGVGTLTEVIHAVNDYNKKVAVFDAGETAEIIKQVPKLREEVFLTDNIKEAFDYLGKKD